MSNIDAIREVALNSRAQAQSYLGQENWGRAFAHLTLCLKLEQSWQEELQEQLSDCLCSWGKQLEEESRYKDLLHCYQQALEIYPNNHEVLNNLGAHLFRKLRRHMHSIILGFEILTAGLKPAFVWDFFVPKRSDLEEAVVSLVAKGLVPPKTVVLTLQKGECLVACTETLLLTVKQQLLVVDISSSLAIPALADKAEEIAEMINSILYALSSGSGSLEAKPGWSGPTLTGLLLGYPVLFWLNPDDSEHCLAGLSLTNFKAEGCHKGTGKSHLITSFSIPTSLVEQLVCLVHQWFQFNFKSVSQSTFTHLKLVSRIHLDSNIVLMGHLEEAKSFFEKALAIKKDFLPAAHNIENLTSILVERWHFRMLNDNIRNESYREAILKKIRQGFSKVLDIGTGTSLLSLYAVQGGAKRVFACECSAAMIEIAKEVISDNNVESKIELIKKMSTDLSIPADIPSRVSLVVTETLDSGVFGENVLQTLIDAWDRLLLPQSRNLVSPRAGSRNGIVVPFGVKIYAAGVQCAAISRMNALEPSVWDALGLGLQGTRLAAAQNEAYNSEKLEYVAGGYTFITSPVAVLEVNFNDPQDLKKHLAGEHDKKMEVSCCDAGQIDAFVSWFVLLVDEDLQLSSEPGKKSCWEQAVFALTVPLELQSGQTVNIAVSSSHGLLKIQPDSQELTPEIMLTDRVAIEMLNDSTWTRSMQMVASSFKGKAGLKVLDLTPFPYLGLLLLKMGVCDKLRCSDRGMSLARKVAGDNCDLDDFNKADKLDCFDLIILYPCTPEGELDQETILYVSHLRKRLSPQGVMLPKYLSIIGQIWNSDWLESVSQLQTDEHVSGFKIASHVNKYKLKRHLDLRLQSTPHAVLSEPKEILSVKLCEHLTEEPAKSELPLISTGKVTAVAHWFQFDYGQGVKFQTNQIDSYPRQAAVLLEDNMTVHEGQKLEIESCLQAGVVNIKVTL